MINKSGGQIHVVAEGIPGGNVEGSAGAKIGIDKTADDKCRTYHHTAKKRTNVFQEKIFGRLQIHLQHHRIVVAQRFVFFMPLLFESNNKSACFSRLPSVAAHQHKINQVSALGVVAVHIV